LSHKREESEGMAMANYNKSQNEAAQKDFARLKNEELEFLTDCFGIGSCNSIAAKYASVSEMEGSEWT
jgi:hypothetical protein